MPGRLSHTALLKRIQITRLAADENEIQLITMGFSSSA